MFKDPTNVCNAWIGAPVQLQAVDTTLLSETADVKAAR